MKKLLLLLFLLIFSNLSYSQDYKPLLDNYNEWNLTYCFNNDCSTDYYYTDGDTIVDGMNFKILDSYHFISRGFLLRENVAQKKVHLKTILPSGISDYLLYDFSLEVGDSIDMKNPITPFPEDAGYYKVDSIIPRPLVDGNNYKHFYLSPAISNTISTNNAIWVEGVGSLSLITAPSGDPDINGVGRVACMFKNGISFYSDLDIIDECEPFFILDVNEFNNPLNEVTVTTLISNDICKMSNTLKVKYIDVYDLNGRKLVGRTNNGNNQVNLDFSSFNSGVYIIVINASQFQKRTFKVVVD